MINSLGVILGPLIALRGFHPEVLKWCSMHVVNLGLLYGSNASLMPLVFELF